MSIDNENENYFKVQSAHGELFDKFTPCKQIILIEKNLSLNNNVKELNYNKKNAGEYKLKKTANLPSEGIIQFIESYDNLWRMKLKNGQVLKSIQINSTFNGFIIKDGQNIEGAIIYYFP